MNITLIGCGWLGLKLGKSLVSENHTVFGSTTTKEKLPDLEEAGIRPFLFNAVENEHIPQEITTSTALLVLTIPPIKRDNPFTYASVLASIIAQFPPDCQVIFTSSTGVYPDREGTYDETYTFAQEELSALYHAEQAVTNAIQPSTVLRLGGLFGEDRHPIHSLVKRGSISNPEGKINFVHRGDVINFVKVLIGSSFSNEFYNLVYPDHPERGAYYHAAAKHFGYPLPTLQSGDTTVRIISSKKSTITLGFSYNYALDLLDN